MTARLKEMGKKLKGESGELDEERVVLEAWLGLSEELAVWLLHHRI